MYKRINPNRLLVIKDNPVCIYKLISPSGKIYIGQTVNLHSRMLKYNQLHCKMQPRLYNSLKKYGLENHHFKVLRTFSTQDSAEVINQSEIDFVEFFRRIGCSLLNVREPGGGRGRASVESKIKMSIAGKGKIPWNKGVRTGLSPANKGKHIVKRSYTYYKDGVEIFVSDLKIFCKENGLTYSAMIEIQSGNGNTGRKGEYKGYTKDKNWAAPIDKRRIKKTIL